MSIDTYIQAMPKADLHVHLEGAVPKDTYIFIAEQNEIPYKAKDYEMWAELLKFPDYERQDEIIRHVSQWVTHADDISRLVYDVGVHLAKQNVRYAEVSVDPTLFLRSDWSFEQFLTALNDGRDRAERGWNIRMSWILCVPRSEPRSGDDIARWASNISSRKAGVVGLGLNGYQDRQPIGQFSRPFRTAEKKELSRVPHVDGDAAEVREVLEALLPNRIVAGMGLVEAGGDIVSQLIADDIVVDVPLVQMRAMGQVDAYANYPLQALYDQGLPLTLGSDMPGLFETDLNTIYTALVEEGVLDIDTLEDVALNAIRYSFLPEDEKATLLAEFTGTYRALRAEHLVSEQ